MINYRYLVDIEFRYSDKPRGDNDYPDHVSKTITIGIYDSYDEAVKVANNMLENELESRFPLNKAWNRKERFGERFNTNLISDMAYLTTPFSFFAHIKKLEFSSVSNVIDEVLVSESRYKEWRSKLD